MNIPLDQCGSRSSCCIDDISCEIAGWVCCSSCQSFSSRHCIEHLMWIHVNAQSNYRPSQRSIPLPMWFSHPVHHMLKGSSNLLQTCVPVWATEKGANEIIHPILPSQKSLSHLTTKMPWSSFRARSPKGCFPTCLLTEPYSWTTWVHLQAIYLDMLSHHTLSGVQSGG